jgi:LysR family glycine cleavage system transcriptional activator
MTKILSKLPSLDGLRGFVAVGRRMSITLAAEDLCLTQSAVSRQVQGLEAQLGVALLSRQHRRVELTEAGRQLFQLASPWLDRLGQWVQHLSAEPLPTVTLSPCQGVMTLWLLPRLGDFQARFPEVDVHISTTAQRVDMAHGGIDLAIRYTTSTDVSRDAVQLFEERIVPVACPALAQRLAANPALLAEQAHIEFDCKPRPWLRWDDWRGVLGLGERARPSTLHYNLYDQVVQAAIAGQGLALGRLPLIQPMLDDSRLIALSQILPKVAPQANGYAHWLLRSPRSSRPEVDALAQWIQAQAQGPVP